MKYIADYIDAPTILDCTITPIPALGQLPLQVVASLAQASSEIVVKDGVVSAFVGLYSGAPGSERLRAIICGPGGDRVQVSFIKGERISIGSLGAAISTGSLGLMFFTDDQR